MWSLFFMEGETEARSGDALPRLGFEPAPVWLRLKDFIRQATQPLGLGFLRPAVPPHAPPWLCLPGHLVTHHPSLTSPTSVPDSVPHTSTSAPKTRHLFCEVGIIALAPGFLCGSSETITVKRSRTHVCRTCYVAAALLSSWIRILFTGLGRKKRQDPILVLFIPQCPDLHANPLPFGTFLGERPLRLGWGIGQSGSWPDGSDDRVSQRGSLE